MNQPPPSTVVVPITPKIAATQAPVRESHVLPQRLPPLAARASALFLIALAAGGAAVAVYVRFPETVKCPFILSPEIGSNPVTAPRKGMVERASAPESTVVKAGDLLFVIRCPELGAMSVERSTLLEDRNSATKRLHELENEAQKRAQAVLATRAEVLARIERLEQERAALEAQAEPIRQDREATLDAEHLKISGAEAEAEVERNRIKIAKELQKKAEVGFEKGATTEWEALRERYAFQQADLVLLQANGRAAEAKKEIAKVEAVFRREDAERKISVTRLAGEISEARVSLQRIDKDSELKEVEAKDKVQQLTSEIETDNLKIASLEHELEGSEGDLMKVFAPYTGTLTKVGPQRPGVVIERGEVLCEIAPLSAPLQVELSIPEKEAGRLTRDQSVRLLLSSYPYTRYGTRRAKLSFISPTGKDGTFRALAVLVDKTVMVDGQAKPLAPGMTGEARIDIGRRTLIEYIFEPLRQLKENIAPPQETK